MTDSDEERAHDDADRRADVGGRPRPSARAPHPGNGNYPPPRRTSARRTPLPPLHPVEDVRRHRGDDTPRGERAGAPRAPRMPRKLTVTRVAALRSRELTSKGIATFRRAATADGADRSGLTALTYATMANFASDAAVAVALANTLFFSAATGEDKTKVALYLLITIAPFAVIAPLIGPLLDRLQHGRRLRWPRRSRPAPCSPWCWCSTSTAGACTPRPWR